MSEDKKGMSRRTFAFKVLPSLVAGAALGLGTAEVAGGLHALTEGHEIPTLENLTEDLFDYKGETADKYNAIITLSIDKAIREKKDKILGGYTEISIYYNDGNNPKLLSIRIEKDGILSGVNTLNTGGFKNLPPRLAVSELAAIGGNITSININSGGSMNIDGDKIPDSIKELVPGNIDFGKIKGCYVGRNLSIDFNGTKDKVKKHDFNQLIFGTLETYNNIHFSVNTDTDRILQRDNDKWIYSDNEISFIRPINPSPDGVKIKNKLIDLNEAVNTVRAWFRK